MVVKELLEEHKVTPDQVMALDIILGGDHGLEAFCLCFCVVVTLKSSKMLNKVYGGAGFVKGKDTTDVLEASIMGWLTEDLKTIHSSQVFFDVLADGSIACALVSNTDEVTGSEKCHTIPNVTIFNTGDLK